MYDELRREILSLSQHVPNITQMKTMQKSVSKLIDFCTDFLNYHQERIAIMNEKIEELSEKVKDLEETRGELHFRSFDD